MPQTAVAENKLECRVMQSVPILAISRLNNIKEPTVFTVHVFAQHITKCQIKTY